MSEFLDPRDLEHPVYRYSQIYTEEDIQKLYQLYYTRYQDLRWFNVIRKYNLRLAMRVLMELVLLLRDGK